MTKTDELQALLAPTVQALGVELLGLEYLPQPGGSLLRLYIDVPEAEAAEGRGVGIEECEQVSREVSGVLDVEDPISGNYTLEVSSPGLERPLFTPAHFARFIGGQAKVTLKLPQDGRRRLQGRITGVEGERIGFALDSGPFEVAHDNIEKARIVPDWAALGLQPSPKRGADKKPGRKAVPARVEADSTPTTPTTTRGDAAPGGAEHE